MNFHLPAILMFTRGTRFWHTAISIKKQKTVALILVGQGLAEEFSTALAVLQGVAGRPRSGRCSVKGLEKWGFDEFDRIFWDFNWDVTKYDWNTMEYIGIFCGDIVASNLHDLME